MTAVAATVLDQLRRDAEARLALLLGQLRDARARKKARIEKITEQCRADRADVRKHLAEMRSRSLGDVRVHARVGRGAAKVIRLTRLEEGRQVGNLDVERTRAVVAAERHYQDELARIAHMERTRVQEIHRAHERSIAAGALRLRIFGRLGPLLEGDPAIVQALGESRAEALLNHALRRPERAHAVLEPQAERELAVLGRAVAEAQREVQVAGGNINMKPPPGKAREVKRSTRKGASPSSSRSAPSARAGRPPRPIEAKEAAPPTPRSTTAKTREARAVAPDARRKGQVPRSGPGISLSTLVQERDEIAQEKAAKAKATKTKATKTKVAKTVRSKRPGKSAPGIGAASPASPAAGEVSAVVARAAAPANTNASPAPLSSFVQRVQPYKVRASCGHIEVRPMRPATAGVPYAEDVVLEAPHGRVCAACEAKRNQTANASRPPEVKAPELTDLTQITARIRADIAAARKDGRLPPLARYTVSCKEGSILVGVSVLPFPVLNRDAFRIDRRDRDISFDSGRFRTRYTVDAEKVRATIEAIVDAYHWDRSDPTTDHHNARFSRSFRFDDESDEWKRLNDVIFTEKYVAPTTPKPLSEREGPRDARGGITDAEREENVKGKVVRTARTTRPGTKAGARKSAPASGAASPASPAASEQRMEAAAAGDVAAVDALSLFPMSPDAPTSPSAQPPAEPGFRLDVQDATPPLSRRGKPREVQQAFDLDSPLFGAEARARRSEAPETDAAAKPPPPPAPVGEIVFAVVDGTTGKVRTTDVSSLLATRSPKTDPPIAPAKPSGVNPYEQKRAARAERLRDRAEKLRAEATGAFARERAIADGIPMGQPILVGHHSERRHRRDLDKMHTLMGKGVKLSKEAEDLERRAAHAQTTTTISSDDPEAVPKLRAKLAALEKQRETIRTANVIVRKGGADRVERLVALGIDAREAKSLLTKDVMGHIGYAPYKLQNLGANILRVQGQIRLLEARAVTPPPPPEVHGEATISESDNRVRIVFPGKPAEEVRTDLKRAGFRYAPSQGAWLRFSGSMAWFEARRVLARHGYGADPAAASAPTPGSPPPQRPGAP